MSNFCGTFIAKRQYKLITRSYTLRLATQALHRSVILALVYTIILHLSHFHVNIKQLFIKKKNVQFFIHSKASNLRKR